MELVHKHMPIDSSLYAAFINAFANVVRGALSGTELGEGLFAGKSKKML
jgi:hypothetical protein